VQCSYLASSVQAHSRNLRIKVRHCVALSYYIATIAIRGCADFNVFTLLLTVLHYIYVLCCGGEQVRTDTRDTSLLLLLLLVFAVGASGYVLREGMKEVSTAAILLCFYTKYTVYISSGMCVQLQSEP
jgi:hypothetical protein